MRPGVAAGHPATAEAGAEILADGGPQRTQSWRCASPPASQTVMSAAFAGCHAIAFDGSRVSNLDGFAAVPSGEGELVEVPVAFGDEVVVYSLGPASCAVPGLPAALGDLWERLGRLPWWRLVEPALALASASACRSQRCTRSSWRCSPPFTPGNMLRSLSSATAVRPCGRPSPARPGDHARDARRGGRARSAYRGSLAEALVAVPGVVLTWDDLRDYEARWRDLGRRGVPRLPDRDPRWPVRRPRALPRVPPASPARARGSGPPIRVGAGDGRLGLGAHDEHGRRRRPRAGVRSSRTRSASGRVSGCPGSTCS